jgi:hypothetical protein
MKKIFSITIISLSFLSILQTGCKKDVAATDPTVGLKKIASAYAIGAATKVEIYAKDSLFTGYNKLFVALYDSITGKFVDDGHIYLNPTMVMPGMSHSTPFENPVSEIAIDQLFPCSITFLMSSMGGSWTLSMGVHNHFVNKEGTASFALNVIDPPSPKIFSFTSLADANKYFVAYIEPSIPSIGMNDMEVAVYKKNSMTSFTADGNMSIVLTPEMPSMGHSSPNNVSPVNVGNGHYKGKVNFTMTGLWRLNLDLNLGTVVADSTHYFDVTL